MISIISLVTIDSIDKAKTLARTLVEEKLVACVNVIPNITSIYFWDNQVCEEGEVLMVMKSDSELVRVLEKRIVELHPYDTPEFVVLEIDQINDKYQKWLVESIQR